MRLAISFSLIFMLFATPVLAETECKIAFKPDLLASPLVLAFKNSWLKADGVNFIPVDVESGEAAAKALASGEAQMAALDAASAVKAVSGKESCVFICAFGAEKEHSLLAPAKSGIKAPEDLSGKILGVEPGSTAKLALQMLLDSQNLDKSAKIMDISADEAESALKTGKIDAYAAAEPLASALAAKKMRRALMLEADAPLMLVAVKKFALANPEALKGAVAGLLAGVDELNDKPGQFGAEAAESLGEDAGIASAAFKSIIWKVRMDDVVIKALGNAAEFLAADGQIEKAPDIPALAPKKFIAE